MDDSVELVDFYSGVATSGDSNGYTSNRLVGTVLHTRGWRGGGGVLICCLPQSFDH